MIFSVVSALQHNGYAILPRVLDAGTVSTLIAAVSNAEDGIGIRGRESVYAIRNLLEEVP